MAEELELSDYINTHELEGCKAPSTQVGGAGKTEQRLLRLGLLTLALLCLIQLALNLSLRLAFHSKADVDPFPFNSSSLVGFCQNEQLQENSTQLSFCCNNLTRLLREYQALERERDLLREKIRQHNGGTMMNDAHEHSGSGASSFTDEF